MKRTSLGDLLKEHEVGKVEVERKVDTGQSDYGELCREYEEVLEARDYPERIKTIDDILAPSDINAFLQVTIKYEQHQNYDWRTGKFISQLIQISYDAGNNGFVLNTQKVKLGYLGDKIQGTEERKIELKIEGDAGNYCGSNSKDSTITIEGNVRDNCGFDSKNSTIIIRGNAGNWCGWYSNNSTITIEGNVENWCGESSNNSTFKVKNKELYERLKTELDFKKRNTLFLIRPNGKEEVYRP